MTSRTPYILAAGLIVAGCGKPKQMGGPPQDYPVNAIVALVKAETVDDALQVVGEVQASESVRLVSEVDATLIEVGVQDGERVKKGQILYKFDERKFSSGVTQAETRVVLAKSELDRTRRLRTDNTVPQQDLDRAEADHRAAEAALILAADNLADAVVLSPLDGVLEDRPVTLGQFCVRGQDLGLLVQTDPLEITFDSPEREAGRLQAGQTAEFRTEAYPDQVFKAEISYLSPLLNPGSRTLRAKARLANPEARLKPGMFGTVRVILRQRPGIIRIPESAVSLHAQSASVVVMDPEGKAEFRTVVTGPRGDNTVEVVSGLKAGEKVVVEGFQKMGPGSKILVSPKSAAYGVNPPPAADAAVKTGAKPLPKEKAPAATERE